MNEAIVDTNVLCVANDPESDLDCFAACTRLLKSLRIAGVLLIDDAHRILTEYGRHASLAGQPGLGDEFLKWVWDNQAVARYCRAVTVTPHPDRGFEEFPADPALASFHSKDRVFVEIALASGGRPPIYEATDSDWWEHRTALAAHGVELHFLCPHLPQFAG